MKRTFTSKLSNMHGVQYKSLAEGEARMCGAGAPAREQPTALLLFLLRFDRLNHDELAHRPFVHELDAPGDLGEERIVFATADV